tara:strand:- start:295 stop:606 length:312 start_codon:yes stop_codon:yes gene_type:complete
MAAAVPAAAAVLPGVLKERLSLEQDRLRSGTAWVPTPALTPPPTTQVLLPLMTLTHSPRVRMTGLSQLLILLEHQGLRPELRELLAVEKLIFTGVLLPALVFL